jgi:hypothetical protein
VTGTAAFAPSVRPSAPAIATAISDWMSNTFSGVSSRSKVSAQRWASLAVSISCALMRTRAPARCTAPSRIAATASSSPIWRRFLVVSRYSIMEVREITFSWLLRASWVNRSSWMPSTKYAVSGSALRLVKGSTAIDPGSTSNGGGSSRGRGCWGEGLGGRHRLGRPRGPGARAIARHRRAGECGAEMLPGQQDDHEHHGAKRDDIQPARLRAGIPRTVPSSRRTPCGPTSNTQASARVGTKPSSSKAIRALPTQSGAPAKPSRISATCRTSQPTTT